MSPAYNSQTLSNSPLQAIGDAPIAVLVWSADTKAAVTAAPASLAFAIPRTTDGTQKKFSVELSFSADPGVFAMEVQTADTDVDGAYISEGFNGNNPGQITAVNAAFFARVELQVDANFGRLRMPTPQTNNVTVTAKVFMH